MIEQFQHPEWLIGLIVLPILWLQFFFKKTQVSALPIDFRNKLSLVQRLQHLIPLLFLLFRTAILTLLIFALARPQQVRVNEEIIDKQGVDIMLAVDVSFSMLAKDLLPDRLSVLKKVAIDFVNKRKFDRIGYVMYSAEALTKVPLTLDHEIIKETIQQTQTGELDPGTAIGTGLATAINHLKHSRARSKIIILMTDGMNNSGAVDPLVAADIAAEKGIKVYTIGIGTNGYAKMPISKDLLSGELIYDEQKVEIDEELLKIIAEKTKGKYYRATDENKLKEIYEEINRLEKSKIDEFRSVQYIELFRIYADWAMILLALYIALKVLLFKSVHDGF